MKHRIIFGYIEAKSQSAMGRIIVLTGARQTGKTTIARRSFPQYTYLSIEDPVQRGDFIRLTAAQWRSFYPQAILDEVQKEPVLIESIKSTYDQFEEPRYILLGSSQFLLMEKVRESLAGRCIIAEIYPLTLPELATSDWNDEAKPSLFVRFTEGASGLEQLLPAFTLDPAYAAKMEAYGFYMKYGGYPALTQPDMTDDSRWEWLNQYVRTFLERDVRDLASFRDLEPFIQLQRYLAHCTGTLLNFSSVAKETGITVPTVQRYIRYMELSYQAILLPAWFSNPLKKLAKAPKVHFMDNGVMQAVLQKRGTLTGSEFESMVVSEIYKQVKTCRLPVNCYHLRTKDGREVDLLLETASDFIAIEVKMTEHVTGSDIRHLHGLQDVLNKPLRHCFVLSNDHRVQHFENNITAVHVAAFLG